MQNFIVLGLIPGTDVQITFEMWLIGAASLLFIITLLGLRHKHLIRRWMILVYLILITKRQPSLQA
jgi:hypothetical protein